MNEPPPGLAPGPATRTAVPGGGPYQSSRSRRRPVGLSLSLQVLSRARPRPGPRAERRALCFASAFPIFRVTSPGINLKTGVAPATPASFAHAATLSHDPDSGVWPGCGPRPAPGRRPDAFPPARAPPGPRSGAGRAPSGFAAGASRLSPTPATRAPPGPPCPACFLSPAPGRSQLLSTDDRVWTRDS